MRKSDITIVCGDLGAMWHGGRRDDIQLARLEGRTFFTMDGASSHDIEKGILDPRSPNCAMNLLEMSATRCRFRENHKSCEEYAEAIRNLGVYGWTVAYITTHCHQNKAVDKKHILVWEDIVRVA